jgi:hypothetical protein
MRTLAMPKTAEPWSLTSLREKLIKIGAKVVSHDRCTTFQMAKVAVPRQMFQEIPMLIAQLRAPPAPGDEVRCDSRRRQRYALMNTSSEFRPRGAEHFAILAANESAAIEFRCRRPPSDGISHPTGRESGNVG